MLAHLQPSFGMMVGAFKLKLKVSSEDEKNDGRIRGI
jgi:hypothetical protein